MIHDVIHDGWWIDGREFGDREGMEIPNAESSGRGKISSSYMANCSYGTELRRSSSDEAAAFVSTGLRAIFSIMSSFWALFWSKNTMRARVKVPIHHSR